jgi:predicted lipid carrier protein YhbT
MLPTPMQLIPQLPVKPLCYLLAPLLNRLFEAAIKEGELDFLEENVFQVVVTGPDLEFYISFQNNSLAVLPTSGRWDLRISGSAYDFMLLATRREDADTLFFQRRIVTEGDTEMGLFLKNFLDSQELSDLPYSALLERGMGHAIGMHDRLASFRQLVGGR